MMDEELKRRIALQTLKYIRDVAEYIEAKINVGWRLTDDAWLEIMTLGDKTCRTTKHDDLKVFFPQRQENRDE